MAVAIAHGECGMTCTGSNLHGPFQSVRVVRTCSQQNERRDPRGGRPAYFPQIPLLSFVRDRLGFLIWQRRTRSLSDLFRPYNFLYREMTPPRPSPYIVSFAETKDNTRRQGKSELAQLWKDMKRDTVSINGRVLKGELGPEAIVGALTRCILAQARYTILQCLEMPGGAFALFSSCGTGRETCPPLTSRRKKQIYEIFFLLEPGHELLGEPDYTYMCFRCPFLHP